MLCASCAEKRQVQQFYAECIWIQEDTNDYFARTTGKYLPLPRWEVNSKGKIPSTYGPGPDGEPILLTDELVIDISDLCSLSVVEFIPEIPKGKNYSWWIKLPTR